MIKPTLLLSVVSLTLACSLAQAEDWPRWRGPRGDGISMETNIQDKWPADGLRKLWSHKVGIGFASPVAVEGKVYLFTLEGKSERLTCYDAQSGNVIWQQEYQGGWTAASSFPGTRATPWIENGRIYTYGGASDLVARNLADGKELWRTNIFKETGVREALTWGQASSPLIVGDLIYVQNGKGGPVAVAVNKNDGKIAWKAQAVGLGGYAQPVLIDVEGTRQLIVFGGEIVYALNPQTGATIWQQPWETKYEVNATTPVYRDGHLLVTSGYDSGSMMLKVGPAGATKLWEHRGSAGNKHVKSRFQGVILEGDNLYANSEGTLRCMSWPDGKIKWENRAVRLGAGGSIVKAGDKLIALGERGTLYLFKATPEGSEKISELEVAEGDRNWATPLIYNGKLYVKTIDEFICFDVKAQ